jgi:structural maintenance of chromosome 2
VLVSILVQIGAEVEALKKTIADLKTAVQTAKDKQKAAKEEIKKLEKDMDEFKNNKEGKINELKVRYLSTRCYVLGGG